MPTTPPCAAAAWRCSTTPRADAPLQRALCVKPQQGNLAEKKKAYQQALQVKSGGLNYAEEPKIQAKTG